jgi:hypothetical protein
MRLLFILALLCFGDKAFSEKFINPNHDFEQGLDTWSIYEGPSLESFAIIEARAANRDFESRHVFLRLPKEARDNQTQYIKIGLI